METWLRSGFHVPGIENASPDLVPVRTRRKMKFGEDGELQLDLALSGFDYPFIEWERRERKPGLRIEIGMAFGATTDASVIAQYQRWIAQAITTLEEFGFDLDVSVTCTVRGSWTEREVGIQKTQIHVKRENEASDFAEWSALFSPGGYRHLVFTAQTIAAEGSQQDMNTGYGSNPGAVDWGITLDEETRVMTIHHPWTPNDFPAASMTEQFLEFIQGSKR
jgi:hypothetical protein